MDRPFMEATIDQLERIFDEHKHKRPVLAQLRDELTRRSRPRANQLLKEVKGVLDGTIPLDTPPPEDSPDYQMTLEDLLPDDGEHEDDADDNGEEAGDSDSADGGKPAEDS